MKNKILFTVCTVCTLGILSLLCIRQFRKLRSQNLVSECVHVDPTHHMIEYLINEQCSPINEAFKAGRESTRILP